MKNFKARKYPLVVAVWMSGLLWASMAATQPAITAPLPTAQDEELHLKIDQVAKDIGELKSRSHSETGAIIAALAGLLGAAIGAWASTRVSAKTAIQTRDQGISQHRLERYIKLFQIFNSLPRQRQALLTKTELASLNQKLTNWYYDQGGGLIMSGLCHKIFLHSRDILVALEGRITDSNLKEDEYVAVFYCCSRLRTALIYDIDGRRELGEPVGYNTRHELENFLGENPDAILSSCVAKRQRANDEGLAKDVQV